MEIRLPLHGCTTVCLLVPCAVQWPRSSSTGSATLHKKGFPINTGSKKYSLSRVHPSTGGALVAARQIDFFLDLSVEIYSWSEEIKDGHRGSHPTILRSLLTTSSMRPAPSTHVGGGGGGGGGGVCLSTRLRPLHSHPNPMRESDINSPPKCTARRCRRHQSRPRSRHDRLPHLLWAIIVRTSRTRVFPPPPPPPHPLFFSVRVFVVRLLVFVFASATAPLSRRLVPTSDLDKNSSRRNK